jgi:hypothetical protein
MKGIRIEIEIQGSTVLRRNAVEMTSITIK